MKQQRQFSSRWFRFYDEVVDDPKIQTLGDKLAFFWVNCLCLASKNGGYLPSVSDIAWKLRKAESSVSAMIAELYEKGLLDQEGDTFSPHNWASRQYESDRSTERVRKHRETKKVLHETFPKRHETVSETPPEQNRTDTEQNRTETEAARGPVRVPTLSPPSLRFDDWWALWSSIRGTSSRMQAESAYFRRVTVANENFCFACTQSYLDGLFDPRKGFNPDNFLDKQALDDFTATWPKARDSPAGLQKTKQQQQADDWANA